jgi:hypothetical protein
MNILERKVLEGIGEDPDAPDVFLDTDEGMAPVRDSLNDAIQEIAMLTGAYKRQYLLPLRTGQAFYRFKMQNGYLGWVTDVWDVERKFRLEQTSLMKLSAFNPRWMVSTGFAEAYMQLGDDVIGFDKKPSASANTIEITVVEIPHAYVTDTERVKLRDSFQYAAVLYAIGEYWATRGDVEEARKYGGRYLEALGLKERYSPSGSHTSQLSTDKEPFPKVTS